MKNKFLSTLFILSLTLSSNAQKNRESNAVKEYGKMAYIDANKTYERLYAKGYKSNDLLEKLGNGHYFNGNLVKAEKYYTDLYNQNQNLDSEFYFRYAQSLKATNNYAKADEMMVKFNQKNGNDSRAKLALEQKDYLAMIKKNSGRYEIANAGINSDKSDYGTAFYTDNKIVFASSRLSLGIGNKKHSWTGENFTNLYVADLDSNGKMTNPTSFGNGINSKVHESTPVFSKDGKIAYFTRNNYLGKKGKDKQGVTLLKIYSAKLEDGKWKEIRELPFNSDDYNVAHPALSNDGKTLYFVSDMPGSVGMSDIYKVAINADDTYGKPVNLGKKINTEGRETFPFIGPDGSLYFASDGHPGLGGLDIFVSSPDGSKDIINVGEPVNSSTDDFAYIINSSKKGFFTSNRVGGKGNDDMYALTETKPLEPPCEQQLAGTITDDNSGKPLPNAKVSLEDQNHKFVKELTSDANGKFDFGVVDCGMKYYIKTELIDYNTIETPTLIATKLGKTEVPISLSKTIVPIKKDDDIKEILKIKEIYFDLNKAEIREDAVEELEKILDVLQQNPTMEIDIRSHTDSRQTAEYNLKLSDKRAKATRDWLISKGINPKRLTAKGYGESNLLNDCSDDVECTDEQHQQNRRSEFIVTKM